MKSSKFNCGICGKPIKGTGFTGLCTSCISTALYAKEEEKCLNCGKVIANHKKTGLCKSCAHKKLFEDENFAKRFFKNLSRKTYGEKKLENFITFCKFPFRYTGDGGFIREGICADFARNDDTQIIEFTGNQLKAWDGDYERYKTERREMWRERGVLEVLFVHYNELDDLETLIEKIFKFSNTRVYITC